MTDREEIRSLVQDEKGQAPSAILWSRIIKYISHAIDEKSGENAACHGICYHRQNFQGRKKSLIQCRESAAGGYVTPAFLNVQALDSKDSLHPDGERSIEKCKGDLIFFLVFVHRENTKIFLL